MTEYTSSNRIIGTLIQIKEAIKQLQDWNKDVQTVDDYYCTPEGMKNLAASCMLIEAIGEGVKLIDRLTQSRLLNERPEIPWQDVIGIRNHIAHGYFDIDGDIVLDVIKNTLDDLLAAIEYFIAKFESLYSNLSTPTRPEGAEAPSPGEHPGYKRNQPCAL